MKEIKNFCNSLNLIFELGIFCFNLYVYYLTCDFFVSGSAFEIPTRAFNLATRAFTLLTRVFKLVTCEFISQLVLLNL